MDATGTQRPSDELAISILNYPTSHAGATMRVIGVSAIGVLLVGCAVELSAQTCRGTAPFHAREVHVSAAYVDQPGTNVYEGTVGYGVEHAGFLAASYDRMSPRSLPSSVDASAYNTGILAGWQFDMPNAGALQLCPLAGVAYFNSTTTEPARAFDSRGEVYSVGGAVGLPIKSSESLTLTPSFALLFAHTEGSGHSTLAGTSASFSGSTGSNQMRFALGAGVNRLTVTPFVETERGANWWGLNVSYRFGK